MTQVQEDGKWTKWTVVFIAAVVMLIVLVAFTVIVPKTIGDNPTGPVFSTVKGLSRA